jgi:hypothetical protein
MRGRGSVAQRRPEVVPEAIGRGRAWRLEGDLPRTAMSRTNGKCCAGLSPPRGLTAPAQNHPPARLMDDNRREIPKTGIQPQAGRLRAQRWYPMQACECCGAEGKDRHHRDGNPLNNAPENIAFLCRRCHMKVDGRMEGFVAAAGGRHLDLHPPKPCIRCGQLSKPRRKGRCNRCAQWLYRTGTERPVE